MGRRKQAITMEVIEETLPEEQPEERPDSEAVETADTDATAEAERKAEAAAEAMEILSKIEDATRNVDNAAMRVAKVKGELKFVKEVYDDHVERLKDLCRTRMERLPLLDGQPEQGGEGGDGSQSVSKDAWKELPLSDLGLPAGVHKSLLTADIGTIGELCDEMNADPLSWWEDISGIGPAAIQAIADKFIDFWREHPECQEYVEDDGDDGEIDAEYEVDEDEEVDEESEDDDEDEDESNEDDE